MKTFFRVLADLIVAVLYILSIFCLIEGYTSPYGDDPLMFGWTFIVIATIILIIRISCTRICKSKNKKANDELDQLKKLKELLDMGAISEEEFNKKKQELL